MAFFLVDIEKRCKSCPKKATVEMKTSGTVSYGYFCKKCGEKEVKYRNAYEMNHEFLSNPDKEKK